MDDRNIEIVVHCSSHPSWSTHTMVPSASIMYWVICSRWIVGGRPGAVFWWLALPFGGGTRSLAVSTTQSSSWCGWLVRVSPLLPAGPSHPS